MEYSQTLFSDTDQCGQSSRTSTAAQYCANDSRECKSYAGMSEAWTFQDWLELMRFAADSLAKTSQLQEKGQALPESEADYLTKSCAQQTLFDLSLYFSKTPQTSEQKADTLSSENWWRGDIPGEMESLPRLMSERPIKESAGGAWRKEMIPTPTVCGNYNRKGLSQTSGDGLATWAKKFPTPKSHDHKKKCLADMKRREPGLAAREEYRVNFTGALSPAWVEWLMGWPIGHTELKHSEMGKSRYARRLHGNYLADHNKTVIKESEG